LTSYIFIEYTRLILYIEGVVPNVDDDDDMNHLVLAIASTILNYS
jgi:hypothetical protein